MAGAFHVLVGVVILVDQIVDDVFQCILGNDLQVQVQRGLHVVAGFGLVALLILLGDDGAVLVHLVNAGAVGGVEVLFKGGLEAVLADVGVHGVALFLVLRPLGVGHGADVAQDMGGVFGVVFPDGGGLDHQAGDVQLQQDRQVLVGDILDEDIVREVCNAAQVEFVAQANDGPGFLIGPGLGDLIALPEGLDQQGGSDVGVQTDIPQVALEIVAPGGGIVVQGVLKGPGGGDGEMVVVFDAQLLAFLQQGMQVLVAVVGGLDNIVVEHQVITGAVANQYITVPVQDIAPGRLDAGQRGVDGGVIGVAFGVDDLQVEKSC